MSISRRQALWNMAGAGVALAGYAHGTEKKETTMHKDTPIRIVKNLSVMVMGWSL